MSKIIDSIRHGVSRAATTIGLPPIRTKPKAYTITNKAGKKGQPFRRIVRHVTEPAQYIQVGVRWQNGEAYPIMQTVRTHRFYHATKGWRTYHHAVPGLNRARGNAA